MSIVRRVTKFRRYARRNVQVRGNRCNENYETFSRNLISFVSLRIEI